MSEPEEDEYTVPLQDQRVWGAGIKRKCIAFVPARSSTESAGNSRAGTESAASRYLSIVLKNKAAGAPDTSPLPNPASSDGHADVHPDAQTVARTSQASDGDTRICPVCKSPLEDESRLPGTDPDDVPEGEESGGQKPRRHESSLAHQLCLAHVHPPSAIDRSRTGVKYLASYGWDPDARLGLGPKGEGVLVPVMGRIKNDTIGLGVEAEIGARKKVQGVKPGGRSAEHGEGRDFKLDAGQVRRQRERDREETERLRNIIFGDDKVAKYLGEGI